MFETLFTDFQTDWPNIIGLTGASGVIIVYCLNQVGKLASDTIIFSGVNLVGSMMIIWSLMTHFNAASFMMEVIWVIASAVGLVRVLMRNRAKPDAPTSQT